MLDLAYQDEGAAFLADRPRAGLFDAPGLGKTCQTIKALDKLGLERGIIVCPASVRDVWANEIKKFSRVPRKVLRGRTSDDLNLWLKFRCDILITSYELATRWEKELSRDFRDFTVWDEAHYLKSFDSQRTRRALGSRCDGQFGYGRWGAYSWLTTGTPMANDPSDIWTWLRYVQGTNLTFRQFTARYFVAESGGFSTKYIPRRETLDELKALIRKYSLRRTLDDVGLDLPPIWITTQEIEGNTAEINALLRAHPGLDKTILDAVDKGGLTFLDHASISSLRRLVGEAKAPVFAKQLIDELAGGLDKIVVFCAHTAPVEILQLALDVAGIKNVAITGSTPPDKRGPIVEAFQNDPECRVFIGNIRAAGEGLTLTAANQLVMLEQDWSPAKNAQAIKRIHRIGQNRHVHVRFVSLAKSIDEQVSTAVAKKTQSIVTVQGSDL
ncbi:DEAD/DEAH box helicase [Sphingomonas sp.]|uniref:DEAD/DEAH box helicase n=1 Tax=Sphingomonas sp. TaxID=28214 RepID=UPI00257BBFC9|nr:DEAD/DEAH box helicase [Sphingomonas sp.]